MRPTLSLAAAALVFLASIPVLSAQAPATPPALPAGTWAPNASPLRTSPPKSPYRGLFGDQNEADARRHLTKTRVAEALQAASAARAAKQPAVVCGMTILPADPSVDPKMLIESAPSDTRHTIRSIPPPVCR